MISGGVAQYRGEKVSELVKSADDKLYAAKNSGRNKIQWE
ncbi:MAG: diguanylate cyclase [Peptococcaceae bacterium]|nr:diguanylate cyclase [Peptococcaceae bacterium]